MIGVIGYGRSGKAVAELIEKLGKELFISDLTRDLSDIPYPNEWGRHTDKLLEMELLVVSPGVPLDIPILLKARERGIPVIGEIEFASRYLKGKLIAVKRFIWTEGNCFLEIRIGGGVFAGLNKSLPLAKMVSAYHNLIVNSE